MRIFDRSPTMSRLIGSAVLIAALAASLGGCVVATPPVAYVQQPVVVAPAPVLVYPAPVYVHPRRGRW